MKRKQLSNIDVSDSVAIGHQKPVVLNEFRCLPNPRPGKRSGAGVNQRHAPVRFFLAESSYCAARQINPNVIAVIPEIQKIVSDNLTFVAEAKYEIAHAVRTIVAHNVPQDRFAADKYHRLRPEFSFLAQTSPESTTKD